MQNYSSNSVRCCLYHLRSLGKLRPFLSARAANAIAVSMVLSRLDCCNSCLWEVPSQQLKRLQLVQNTAARIFTRTRNREHITPVLKELQWLPVRKHIDHKIMSLAYKCYKGTTRKYWQDLMPDILLRDPSARHLRSSSQPRLRIPSATEKIHQKAAWFQSFL